MFAAVITGCALMNFSNGPAAGNANATGSPGSTSCGAGGCHGSVNTARLSIDIIDANSQAVTEYTPGEVYSITYTISAATIASASRWGMQSAVLDASDAQAGTLANASANLNTVNLGGIDFVEHGPPSSDSTFSVTWTAPAAGTGDVTVYANGIAANNNGAASSDAFAGGTPITLTEMVMDTVIDTTSIYDRSFDARYKLYPNPVQANLVVESPSAGTLQVFSLAGQLVLTTEVANGINSIDATAIESGLYLATVSNEDGVVVNRTKLIRE